MKQVCILSDTHGFLHPRVEEIITESDQVWHAGDIGNIEVLDKIKTIKPVKAVYGNIDDQKIRSVIKEAEHFTFLEKSVLLIHIGGDPGRYSQKAKVLIAQKKPDIFVTGHSHILKVMHDKKNNLLFINPGAAGKFGSHKVITVIKLIFEKGKISNLQVVELTR